MKKRWLIPIAGLTVALVTSATVTAFALTGDGSDSPLGESVGTQEPAFPDGGPGLISPPNPTITDGDPDGSVTIVNDDPTKGGDSDTSVVDVSDRPDPEPLLPGPGPASSNGSVDPISTPLPRDPGRETLTKIGCDAGNGQGIAVGEPHPDTGGPLPLAPEPDGDVEPGVPIEEVLAPIDAVEIVVMESDPPQYGLRVVSGLPHSGVRFLLLDWERSGDTIEVTVLNGELLGMDLVFAQVYGTVENYVNLGADFERGKTDTVLVNDVTETFVAQ